MKNLLAGVIGATVFAVVCSVSVGAQWPFISDPERVVQQTADATTES